MKAYILSLLILVAIFPDNLHAIKRNINSPKVSESEDYSTIYITTSYYIEGAGKHQSKLSKGVGWGMCGEGKYQLGEERTFTLGYDCHALEKIHSKTNSILSQANIKLTSERNCERTPCAIWTNIPSGMALTHKVGNINVGVNPKSYRNKLNEYQKLIEGLFITHANLLAQNYENNWKIPGYEAELFIHFVKSVKINAHSNVIGVYVPEGYRTNYTNQKIRIKNHSYPSNTTRYIIIIGYDDLANTDEIAETVAHEIGHALGLNHFDVDGNLMTSKGLGNTNLTSYQISRMRKNWPIFRKYGAGVSDYKSFCKKNKNVSNLGRTTIDKISVDVKHNVMVGGKKGMKIYPMFTVRNAKNKKLRVSAYFYFEGGEKLKDFNGKYMTANGDVSTGKDIQPCCDNTNYSLGTYYDFYLFIPYNELHLSNGIKHKLKFYVIIWDGVYDVIESSWFYFYVDKR